MEVEDLLLIIIEKINNVIQLFRKELQKRKSMKDSFSSDLVLTFLLQSVEIVAIQCTSSPPTYWIKGSGEYHVRNKTNFQL